jgi:hypothetical protein
MGMTQNPKRHNAITLIHAKSQQALGEFPTMHFTKCFKFWWNHKDHCVVPMTLLRGGTTMITHFSFNLHLPYTNLTLVQKGVLYSGSKIYNHLPLNTEMLSTNAKQFK